MAFDWSKGIPVTASTTEQPSASGGFDWSKGETIEPPEDRRGPVEKFNDTMRGGALGFLKGRAKTALNILGIGNKIGNFLKMGSRGTTGSEELPGFNQAQEALKPTNTAEQVGDTAGSIAEYTLPFGKVAKVEKGMSWLGKAGTEALVGGGVTTAQEGELNKDVALNTGISFLFPAVGAAKNAITKSLPESKNTASRLINSLIKPLQKDLSYGKDPGRAVAEEGIIAKDMEELAQKIVERRQVIGQQISSKIAQSKASNIDASEILAPIDEAIRGAMEAPRTNSSLIQRLMDIKADLLGESVSETGEIVLNRKLQDLTPQEVFDLKQLVGSITKFTGNASDDKMTNSALKNVYGKLKEKLNTAVEGLAPLNEKYADLTSAEIATKYRDKIMERQNLVKFDTKTAAIVAGAAQALVTGGAGVGTAVAALGAAGLERALSSPTFKTNMAAWLAKATPAEKKALLNKAPFAKSIILDNFGKITGLSE